ncbi:unnamed protein product [Thlaspi arvense]|uniref:Uncharacterized protein n=1 Tax=Thlaspi arvense TaxID=13288 RepID=A0AAU9RCT7_THLAR|nr:unnamed protein product [Thlaspi arvense]
MEKASNNNSTKLSKMLQRALSIGHSAAPFTPARDLRHQRTTSMASRGFFFSSPITPLLPTAARARRKNKNAVVWAEPTSPKVSCIGQIKLSKPKCPPENKNRAAPKNLKMASSSLIKEEGNKGSFSKLKRLFSTGRNPSRKSISTDLAVVNEYPVAVLEAVAAPSLGKMKKFASSREALGGFEWTVEMKREESRLDHRRCYSSDDEEVMIPCSVSLPLTQREGLSLCPKPKSEVNLWKRRTVDRPKPLQLKATC